MSAENSLKRVRRHWERNAHANALGTILTRSDKVASDWDQEAFFATGRADVSGHLARLKDQGFVLKPGKALDFGCGVGRLTRPLAESFGSAVGVDVSEHMIELAGKLHAGAKGLEFVHNLQPDLSRFPDGSFDFVFSLITLQHMPSELQVRYLNDLVRVCKPGGYGVVQMMTGAHHSRKYYWPPTLFKWLWRRLNQVLALVPVMAMYTVPEAEVLSILASGGAELTGKQVDSSAGTHFDSRVFEFRKR